eukprot:c35054_g1_i1 orf=1-168(-)
MHRDQACTVVSTKHTSTQRILRHRKTQCVYTHRQLLMSFDAQTLRFTPPSKFTQNC